MLDRVRRPGLVVRFGLRFRGDTAATAYGFLGESRVVTQQTHRRVPV